VKILTPRCPGCEKKGLALSPVQVFCENEDCHVISWDATKSLEELARNPHWHDLSWLNPKANDS